MAYSPKAATPGDGFDLATLTVTCPDLKEPVSVNLQGRCEEPVALEAVTVLPVENLTEEGYTLRWLPLAVEPDTYTVTRKIYEGDDSVADIFTYEVEGNVTSIEITDRDSSRREALSVVATLDGKDSPAGNEVLVQTSGIESVESEADGTVRYFDAAGFELPSRPETPGIYVVRVGSHTAKTVILK